MDPDTYLFPSSPSNDSLSSSDLDTESTASFFPDRSTTLGSLMGVTYAEAAARSLRLPSRREHGSGGGTTGGDAERRPKPRAAEKRRRRRRWGKRRLWRLCGDGMEGPTSLGEFLQRERRLAGVATGRRRGSTTSEAPPSTRQWAASLCSRTGGCCRLLRLRSGDGGVWSVCDGSGAAAHRDLWREGVVES